MSPKSTGRAVGMPKGATALYRAYRLATRAVGPLAQRSAARKLRAGGVSHDRIAERAGRATLPRPEGRLAWFHAASVGESLAVLSLMERLRDRRPGLNLLITSGTATSAALLARRLPEGACHQFAPLDTPGAVRRFLDHWHPDAGIFVESELWPNMLVNARARGIGLALVNARLSEKSVAGWERRPDTARFVLGCFDLFITQNAQAAENLRRIGATPDRITQGVNLKSTSAPPPVDAAALALLRDRIGPQRPVWTAASTHPGEEEIVLDAHARLLVDHPGTLLILVPRHPDRADAVAALVAASGLRIARRSHEQPPGPDTQVYLADTLGEMGLWFSLAPIVFLGGSLLPIGGHNPFEPASFGAALLSGPHVVNFSETFEALAAKSGVITTPDAGSIAAQVSAWLADPAARETAARAARDFATRGQDALDEIAARLADRLLPEHGERDG